VFRAERLLSSLEGQFLRKVVVRLEITLPEVFTEALEVRRSLALVSLVEMAGADSPVH